MTYPTVDRRQLRALYSRDAQWFRHHYPEGFQDCSNAHEFYLRITWLKHGYLATALDPSAKPKARFERNLLQDHLSLMARAFSEPNDLYPGAIKGPHKSVTTSKRPTYQYATRMDDGDVVRVEDDTQAGAWEQILPHAYTAVRCTYPDDPQKWYLHLPVWVESPPGRFLFDEMPLAFHTHFPSRARFRVFEGRVALLRCGALNEVLFGNYDQKAVELQLWAEMLDRYFPGV